MVLDDSLKQAYEEMGSKTATLKEVRPSSAKVKKDLHQIKTMENQLDKALIKYNRIQSDNQSLRKTIDVQR